MNQLASFSPSFLLADIQTSVSIQPYLRGSERIRLAQIKLLPRFVCADGFSLSVQASNIHRCSPQNLTGPYSTVECGCLSEPVPELMPYITPEDGIPETECSYQNVPVETLVALINRHGGLCL